MSTDDPAHDPDDERTWHCLFCGQLIGEARPLLYGEVAWDGGEYATFSAHPRCFMDAAHQSVRDEGYFDPATCLPLSELPEWPAEAEVGDLVLVADFQPPDARDQFRRWRAANSQLLNELSAGSIRVDSGRADGGDFFRVWLARDAAPRAQLG